MKKQVTTALAVSTLALAASTIIPIGLAPPARAAACGQFAFTGFTAINQSNGYRLEFNSTGTQASGPVTAFDNHQAAALRGTISGGISGRAVSLNVTWNGGMGGYYNGNVNDEGMARGDTVASTPNPDNPESSFATWNMRDPLVCADAPAAQSGPTPNMNPSKQEINECSLNKGVWNTKLGRCDII